MHIFFLGICGTFMGSLAILARQLGYQVAGCDVNVYPPMSTLLASEGITVLDGFEFEQIPKETDLVVVGNVMKRGMPIIEALLGSKLPFTSGPEWLRTHILQKKHVLAVSGTHGKTTTSSLLAWILEYAGKNPSFLIGGVPENFKVSSRLTDSPYFVIEADEYDTAFFDKRSKFLHYWPSTLIINNIEFDHVDIFADLNAIKTQFHHLMRLMPKTGRVIANSTDQNIQSVLEMGIWSEIEYFGLKKGQWTQALLTDLNWPLFGEHNLCNALAAIAAAHHVGIEIEVAKEALLQFQSVKRRLEVKAHFSDFIVYDDFAHHPTAFEATLDAVKNKHPSARIIAIVDIGSNTMRAGTHQADLSYALAKADHVYLAHSKPVEWSVDALLNALNKSGGVYQDAALLVERLVSDIEPGDVIVLMSNSGFNKVLDPLIQSLRSEKASLT